MTTYEIAHGKFEGLPQTHQLYTAFTSKIEELFETL